MEHKLATIEKITEIKDIVGADRIQAAKIQGYWSVIKKGEYVPGSWVFFVQPDTKCHRAEWNRFLWPKDDPDPLGKDIRIKVAKFRGQVSYGLIVDTKYLGPLDLIEGADVTEKLGVTKYEKFEYDDSSGPGGNGNNRGRVSNFPGFLRKTDECALKSYHKCFDEYKGLDCYLSVKFDGSSETCYLKDGKFGVCSRKQDIEEIEGNKFWYVARKYDIENKLKLLPYNVAIQFECVGPGTNGNKLGLKDWEIHVFNLFDINEHRYRDFTELEEFCNSAGLPIAKVIWRGKFEFESIEQIEDITKGLTYENGNPIEGLVLRPQVETFSNYLKDRLSTKIINPLFALKYGE
jgi:RNA ligase (TIGR02306 family)